MKTVQFQYFPKNKRISKDLRDIIDVFADKYSLISSPANNLGSDAVLGIVTDGLVELGFNIEKSKKRVDKIQIPYCSVEMGGWKNLLTLMDTMRIRKLL